ncbi:MAG: type II toxin-antitoxin system RelE/ParE family toxin [Candidatus Gracilibacteria bacterium]|nr:type II toxin-antitoxin system RelE/ParE family toxin [Candidatus Gracilibacteria bacterium]MDQ7022770.1 type II toxin-antitoxin system RelE/ParE family toxin [Candidatus Gracilibacteria bacterium]
MYNILFKKEVIKFLKKHKGEKIISDFEKSLIIIAENPYKSELDIKPLKGLENNYRLRIGKYRFLYLIKESEISIYFFNAGKRGYIYKNI